MWKQPRGFESLARGPKHVGVGTRGAVSSAPVLLLCACTAPGGLGTLGYAFGKEPQFCQAPGRGRRAGQGSVLSALRP